LCVHKNKLNQFYLGFALHGYKNETMKWLKQVESLFEENGYPLKSASYLLYAKDYKDNSSHRQSLKTFYKKTNTSDDFPQERLFSFTAFSGENQKYPDTWHYGCYFNKPSGEIVVFFDTSYGEEVILLFYKSLLEELLKNKAVELGIYFIKNTIGLTLVEDFLNTRATIKNIQNFGRST